MPPRPPVVRPSPRLARTVGLAAAMLLLAAAPASAATPPLPLVGPALGPDRLPDCAAVVAAMTPRARLAQRLMVGVDGSDPAATAEIVRSTQLGGLFVGGNATTLLEKQQLRGVQAMSRVPLMVAVDDEGGRVQRVDTLDGRLLSARALTRLSPIEVRKVARDRGRALVARGITANFAPVVDVSDQRANAVIGDRSFGDDSERVTRYAAAFASGEREAGVYTVLKHFPGHGHADGDSHLGPVTTPPLDVLRSSDLKPYADLLGEGGPLAGTGRTGVMVGHLDVPDLTDGLPSSLTPAVYELLRQDYGFDGMVVTDDLGAMKAVTGRFELPEAVELALSAGADMALWTSGGPVGPVLERLDQALAAGRLDADDGAVARILAAKGTCGRR